MKHIKIIIATAALFLLASCTFIRINRNLVSEEKISVPPGEEVSQISDASVFTINVPADIKYVQTPGKPYLTIMATPAIREQIVILQDGSGVTVKSRGNRIKGNVKDLDIRIGTSSLTELNINGAADFEIDGGLEAPHFTLNTNGASEVDIDRLMAGEINVNINGAADIDLKHVECDKINVTVNGAGDISIGGHASAAALSVNGAGEIDVRMLAADELVSDIHGLGRIKRR